MTDLALNDDVPWLEVGFSGYREPVLNTATNQWEIVYDGPCYYYPYTVPQDGWWKFAKTMDFMAVVIGGAGSMFIWMASCCTFSKATWRVAGYEILLASIFQASSFTWLKNSLCQQGTCTLFWGSKADIVASVLWFVASIYIIAFYPQPKERDDGDGVFVDETASVPQMEITDSIMLDGNTQSATETTQTDMREVNTAVPTGEVSQQNGADGQKDDPAFA